jgi:hypothetical protein
MQTIIVKVHSDCSQIWRRKRAGFLCKSHELCYIENFDFIDFKSLCWCEKTFFFSIYYRNHDMNCMRHHQELCNNSFNNCKWKISELWKSSEVDPKIDFDLIQINIWDSSQFLGSERSANFDPEICVRRQLLNTSEHWERYVFWVFNRINSYCDSSLCDFWSRGEVMWENLMTVICEPRQLNIDQIEFTSMQLSSLSIFVQLTR